MPVFSQKLAGPLAQSPGRPGKDIAMRRQLLLQTVSLDRLLAELNVLFIK